VTIQELQHAVHLSRKAVLAAMSRLETIGLAQTLPRNVGEGKRGRPVHRYTITHRSFATVEQRIGAHTIGIQYDAGSTAEREAYREEMGMVSAGRHDSGTAGRR